jgi:hypothetical protein
MKISLATLILSALILIGCDPAGIQTNEEPETPAVSTPSAESVQLANHRYMLLTEPWKKYFRGTPRLLIIDSPTKGIQDLLEQEQSLIKIVLDSSGSAKESSEYVELEERLNELKTMIPDAETASGYVTTRSSRSYSYISGDTIYTRRGGNSYYDGYHYTTFREKHKSSSPDLVRSVQGLVHNATLEPDDLDQRINALQSLISQWSRRTSVMGANGTSGIMREANEAYLSVLREFTNNFSSLRTEIKKNEANQAQIVQNKSSVLARWSTFETNRLSILDDYFKAHALSTNETDTTGSVSLSALKSGQTYILSCTIGQRDLYFEVSPNRHKLHPFILVDVTPK